MFALSRFSAVLLRCLRPIRDGALLVCLALIAPAAFASATSPPAGESCRSGQDLAIVAHMDDDLLFMNPDLQQIIAAGRCLTVLYLTASERDEGVPYMLARERAVRAAYAYMAAQPDQWTIDALTVGEHTLSRQRLPHRPGLTLLFMRLEDPWLGKGWGSLTPLSRTESEPMRPVATIGEYVSHYTRPTLIQTVAALIAQTEPDTIRHLDDTSTIPYTALCWRCVGHGHPDHIASAKLVREAIAQAPGHYATIGYVDYPIQDRDANLPAEQSAAKTAAFLRYANLDWRYCQPGQACRQPYGPTAAWVQRSYYLTRQDTAPALFPDPQQHLILATTEEWSNTAASWHADPSQATLPLGHRSAEAPQAFRWPDGAAGLLLRDTLGTVWSARLSPSDEQWSTWTPIAGANIQTLARLPMSQHAALGLGPDQQLYWSEAFARGQDWLWQDWQPLPPLPAASADAAWFADQAQQWHVFALAGDGALYATQRGADHLWQAWTKLPMPPSTGGLAAAAHHDQQTLFFRDRQGMLQRTQRHAAQARWSPPENLGLSYIGQPAIATHRNGELTLSALERNGGPLWILTGDQPAQHLNAQAASSPALAWADGRLHLAIRQVGAQQTYARWHQDPASKQWLADTAVSFAPPSPATPTPPPDNSRLP